ncbi:MAG: class I SAM-dependent methyltransferase [Burkholderiaceae bacterium]
MILSQFINQILGRLGVAVIRKQTLNRLIDGVEGWTDDNLDAGDRAAIAEALPIELMLKEIKESIDHRHKQQLRHQISVKWEMVDLFERHRIPSADLSCPLCDYRGEVAGFGRFVTGCIFEGGTLIRHQCPECDLIFGAEKMLNLPEAELSRDYEWHYQIFSEGDSTAQEVRAFHALHPEKDRVYLNWGTGAWSKSMDVLRQEGWNVYGYEPHSSATASSPYIISNMEQLSTMRFDGIFSNNVLEHLRYPVRELSIMRDLLKSGGKMSHATPCFEYLYEFTRFHLFFYLGRSRAILAAKAELSIDDFVVDGEFMNIILTKG